MNKLQSIFITLLIVYTCTLFYLWISNVNFIFSVQAAKFFSNYYASDNPHIRIGSAVGLGISCLGLKDAIGMLKVLMEDNDAFVRHAAMVSLSMVLTDRNDIRKFRHLLKRLTSTECHNAIKTGAILATGLLDAAETRRVRVTTKGKNDRILSVIGVTLFTQYWHSFPMIYFIGLAYCITPSIKLNFDSDIPQFVLEDEDS